MHSAADHRCRVVRCEAAIGEGAIQRRDRDRNSFDDGFGCRANGAWVLKTHCQRVDRALLRCVSEERIRCGGTGPCRVGAVRPSDTGRAVGETRHKGNRITGIDRCERVCANKSHGWVDPSRRARYRTR